ncbi:iron-sulfur cluster assembly accessory protein [Thiotrichales bacterium 19S3-7]|nr:iron-sulfur cluster assembly accessory protein [Thiotrichales bacterium 19S3-7]MCF6801393.1 iron-sulfur cluster assembly accessory protein [Thiotrichales bacterium 19S3-11]
MSSEVFDPKKQLVTLTVNAQEHFRDYIKNKGGVGVRLGVKKMGCSGLGYVTEVIDQVPENHTVLEFDEISVYVDNDAILYLSGLVVDFVKKEMGLSQLVYHNPNESARCGCGESFTIAPSDSNPYIKEND